MNLILFNLFFSLSSCFAIHNQNENEKYSKDHDSFRQDLIIMRSSFSKLLKQTCSNLPTPGHYSSSLELYDCNFELSRVIFDDTATINYSRTDEGHYKGTFDSCDFHLPSSSLMINVDSNFVSFEGSCRFYGTTSSGDSDPTAISALEFTNLVGSDIPTFKAQFNGITLHDSQLMTTVNYPFNFDNLYFYDVHINHYGAFFFDIQGALGSINNLIATGVTSNNGFFFKITCQPSTTYDIRKSSFTDFSSCSPFYFIGDIENPPRVEITNCSISSCSLEKSTFAYGFIIFEKKVSCRLEQFHFSNNNGCCIFGQSNSDDFSDYEFVACTFTNNAYNGEYIFGSTNPNPDFGSVISIKTENIRIFDCQFNENNGYKHGGVFYILAKTSIEIESSGFQGNSLSNETDAEETHGGSLYIDISEIYNAIADITLNGTKFENNGASNNGGAIFFKTKQANSNINLNFDKCDFINCNSSIGGSIYYNQENENENGKIILSECIFDGCSADDGQAIYCRIRSFTIEKSIIKNHIGGAAEIFSIIIPSNENPIFKNCTFQNNDVDFWDFSSIKSPVLFEGLVFSDYPLTYLSYVIDFSKAGQLNNNDRLTFQGCSFTNIHGRCVNGNRVQVSADFNNCTFYEISSTYQSSCFNIMTDSPYFFNIHDSIFENIASYSTGGAIQCYSLALNLMGCTFIRCRCENPYAESEISNGGALYIDQHNLNDQIYDCKFYDCYAKHDGGAIYAHCTDSSGKSENFIEIHNCIFSSCISGREGGAVSSGLRTGDKSTYDNDMSFTNCQFIRCQSGNGGALYFQDGTQDGDEETLISSCIFDNCQASEEGHSLYCRSYKLTLSDSTFKNHNSASEKTISFCYINMNENNISPEIIDCKFENNDNSVLTIISGSPSIEFRGLEFDGMSNNNLKLLDFDNWINSGSSSKTYTFTNCNFSNIKAISCFNSEKDISISIFSSTFDNIESSEDGACFYIHTSGSSVNIDDCTFENINSNGNGAAIHARTDLIEVQNSTFIDCSCGISSTNGKGGAIYFEQPIYAGEERISECIFTNCRSTFVGGSVFIYSEDTRVRTSYFINCVFTDSTSSERGGAVLCGEDDEGHSGTNGLTFQNCEFVRCHSKSGGALYTYAGSLQGLESLNVDHCIFENCFAEGGEGHAIHSLTFECYLRN